MNNDINAELAAECCELEHLAAQFQALEPSGNAELAELEKELVDAMMMLVAETRKLIDGFPG